MAILAISFASLCLCTSARYPPPIRRFIENKSQSAEII
jgi:hypothetical protein